MVWLVVLGDASKNPRLEVGKGVTLLAIGLSMHRTIINGVIHMTKRIEEVKDKKRVGRAGQGRGLLGT